MLSDLMQVGGYCVRYINMRSRGLPAAFGFYVCDVLREGEAYSRQAKRHLYQGLSVIQAKSGWGNLVGVYMDVPKPEDLSRPAYRQLKADLQAGFFRRVFVICLRDQFGEPEIRRDVETLYQEIEGFELIELKEYSLPGDSPFSWSVPAVIE